MSGTEKRVLTPLIDVAHDADDGGFHIEIDLAGAAKDSVNLDVGKYGFCITAEGDDFRYESCYNLAHEVKAAEATARFNSGLLTVHVPFEETVRGYKVAID